MNVPRPPGCGDGHPVRLTARWWAPCTGNGPPNPVVGTLHG